MTLPLLLNSVSFLPSVMLLTIPRPMETPFGRIRDPFLGSLRRVLYRDSTGRSSSSVVDSPLSTHYYQVLVIFVDSVTCSISFISDPYFSRLKIVPQSRQNHFLRVRSFSPDERLGSNGEKSTHSNPFAEGKRSLPFKRVDISFLGPHLLRLLGKTESPRYKET